MTDVCVVGTLLVDHIVRIPKWPAPGETVRATGHERRLGGKGFNQAVGAARAGASVSLVGAVGADEHGDDFLAFLSAEGIDTCGVRRAAVPTGFAVPVVEEVSADNAIVIVPLANDELDARAVAAAAPAITGSRVVALQLELGVDVAATAAKLARSAGARVVLNAAPALPGANALHGLVDHLVVNEQELRAVAGSGNVLDRAHKARARWDAESVVVTLGAAGAVAVWSGGELSVPGHAVPCVDAVGAGDAFCGTLAARLAARDTVAGAVRVANAAGALAVTVAGAGPAMPHAADVLALLHTASTGAR